VEASDSQAPREETTQEIEAIGGGLMPQLGAVLLERPRIVAESLSR
jgi:hypothetical protein